MPSWEIHNKWAEKLGLPLEYTEKVNEIIDFSREGHDRVIRYPGVLTSQSRKLWKKYGDDIVKAFILCLQLDVMARHMYRYLILRVYKGQYRNIDADRAVKWTIEMMPFYMSMGGSYKCHGIEYGKIIAELNDFIKRNKEEIFSDIKEEILRKYNLLHDYQI